MDQATEDDLWLKPWLDYVSKFSISIQEVRSAAGQMQGALGFRLQRPTVRAFPSR